MTPLPRYLLPDTASTAADGELMVGGCRLTDLAAEYGTPLFVYDEMHIRKRARDAVSGFGAGNVIYAAKAFLCKAMARLAHEEGLRLDVASGGEMEVVLAAGVPPSRLVFHGNNKSASELGTALARGVGRIVVDSFDEVDRIERLVADRNSPAPVLLRITPGVEAHTHEFIATGQEDTKFGFAISSGAAAEAVQRVLESEAFALHGLHAHIGSQVFRIESFAEAGRVIARFARPYSLPELVLGGGLGVAYVEGERSPDLIEWASAIKAATSDLGGTTIAVEPGRALVASAAITLYTVGTIKDLPGVRTYVAVDGGMSDNPRPVLYGSGYETFLPRAVEARRTRGIRLVGKHCESGDLLVRNGLVPPDLRVGDIIATPVTGAYGHSMGSNYNKILRPPVVFVSGGRARLVVRRETTDDLMATDVG